MKKRSAALGSILAGLGRITPDDIERALGYQREHGGFFGEALIAMGLLSPEEVNFALADQYDLPFVHLRPENIDRAVASRVPADWARRHRLIPVLRDGDTVTVLLAAPPRDDELEAVLRFTGAGRLEPAISTPETIAHLIDAVHSAAAPPQALLGDWLRECVAADAAAFGVSVRDGRVIGWYRTGAAPAVRSRLDGHWRPELAEHLTPFQPSRNDSVRQWPAILQLDGAAWRVHCASLGNGTSHEFVVRFDTPVPADLRRADAAPELLAALAARTGARLTLRVGSPDDDRVAPGVLEILLPGLPEALDGQPVRSLHLADRPVAVPAGTLAMQLDAPLSEVLASTEAFGLDAITLDVARLETADLELAHRAAPLIAFRDAHGLSNRLRSDLDVGLRPGNPPRWTLLS